MRRSRFSEEQIISVLKEHEAGMKTADLCRNRGTSDARHKGTDSRPAGGEPALEPRLRVGCSERWSALPGAEYRRRLHP